MTAIINEIRSDCHSTDEHGFFFFLIMLLMNFMILIHVQKNPKDTSEQLSVIKA
jgi:hypothetical protein